MIAGDYPARTRIVLTEKSANNQRSLLWGFRSLYNTSASEAALFFDAYTLTPINGATSGTEAGTFSGKKLEIAAPELEMWHPFCSLMINNGAKHLTHIGDYRVLVRAKLGSGDKLRLVWSNDDATAPINNSAMTTTKAGWQIFDLGEIRLEEPPVGEHFWTGLIEVETGGTSNAAVLDGISLQPLDDGAGRERATAVPASTLLGPSKIAPSPENSSALHAGTAWTGQGSSANSSKSTGLKSAWPAMRHRRRSLRRRSASRYRQARKSRASKPSSRSQPPPPGGP